MNIIHMRTFFTVATMGSFSKAAEKLFITQSTVSKHIICLEKELGIQLLNRKGREVSLTECGKKMLQYYSEILEIYDASQVTLEEIKNREKNKKQLLIVGDDRMSHYGVVNSLMNYIKMNQDVKLSVDDTGRKNVLFALNSGAYELAFCQKYILDSKLFSWQYFYKDQYVAVVPSESELARRKVLFLTDLKLSKIIIGSQENDYYKQNLTQENFDWDVIFETDDPVIAIEFLISMKNCIYIAPKTVMSKYPGKLTKQIPIKGLGECEYVLAWKKKTLLSDCVKGYLSYLRKHDAEEFIQASLNRKFSGERI